MKIDWLMSGLKMLGAVVCYLGYRRNMLKLRAQSPEELIKKAIEEINNGLR